MASRRGRDYRRIYRPYESKNAWLYPANRSAFHFQRDRRTGNDDHSALESRLFDSPVNIHSRYVGFELVNSSSRISCSRYTGKARVIVFKPDENEASLQLVQSDDCSAVTSNSTVVSKLKGVTEQVDEEDPDGPPLPKVSLYPENKIVLGWRELLPVGAGMYNLGNTCYINSTLQALFHIPSFCHWLLNEGDHNICENDYGDKCIICVMFYTLKSAQSKSGNVIKPSLIYSRLKSICRHMCQGRQEDAHEFFRYLLEKMELSYLDRFKGKQLDNASKETTPLHRIFGGYMRTEISCGICRGASTTFQHFQDLLLDIRRSSSLENAMKLFFSSESLEGDDGDGEGGAYRCSNCQKKGFCIKRNYIQIAPKVLCIQLKRFTAMGGKIVKAVAYPEVLDVTPYVFNKNNLPLNSSPNNQEKVPLIYQLTSIVSHCGSSMNSGHYTATAKSSNGTYFEFDDAVVHQVSVSTALSMSAYILIYEMVPSTSDHYLEFTSHKSLSHTVESEKTFGIPPNHPKLVFGSSARHVNGVLPSPVNCSPLPSMKERGKVYFGVKPGNVFAAMALPTASNGRPQGLSESNGVSIKRSELCVNSKANGASPCQTSRNHSKSTLGSQFPYSMTVYEKISKSGLTNEMESDLVDKRTVDHLVPYPVSGDSSDEEEDRRRRKASENRLLKCPAASEMTISGNLTPDATALATKRGWTVAENKRHDSMKYKVSPPSNLPTPSSDSHKASSFKSILKIFDGSSCMDTKGQSPSKCSMIDKDPPSIVKGVYHKLPPGETYHWNSPNITTKVNPNCRAS